ncbi:hypothetical protein BRADI_1g03235v3 [Brachypodium distachyon]|uniref:SET domain-containing protein n=1 Tax=Brachypodium distachyon TaxID=15368 RepID=A0A2K2DHW1_BRADI|nr:hypothetical protein BRADI_1g03235v3 [Brachypodium distachyon]PNT73871.1 hypothetical protein BRADI_1g03235v3 [Brachypodium distachyon]
MAGVDLQVISVPSVAGVSMAGVDFQLQGSSGTCWPPESGPAATSRWTCPRARSGSPVPVCNKVDQDNSPLDFEYIAHPDFPAYRVRWPVKRYQACRCGTACGAAGRLSAAACKCACVLKNGGGPAYNADGTLVRGRPMVYECGALCGCPAASCLNRVTQRGMEHRLEVFRSKETEWGVRTLDLIQPGAFVCEYSGDVLTVDDGQSTDWGNYVDPRKFPARWMEWGDASAALPDKEEGQHKFPELTTGPGYVLDVSRRRNLAVYISHSSAPNVFAQFVIRGNEDESYPHLMVFAMDTIPPMRELSVDYGIDRQDYPCFCPPEHELTDLYLHDDITGHPVRSAAGFFHRADIYSAVAESAISPYCPNSTIFSCLHTMESCSLCCL